MKTTNGKPYSMFVFNSEKQYVAPSTNITPLFVFKTAASQFPNFWIASQDATTADVVIIQKPILPLYCTHQVVVAGIVLYSFSTPYLVNINTANLVGAINIPPVPRNYQYAAKIAPYCYEDFYENKAPTGNNQKKQFIGQICFPDYEKIRFSSNDFIWDEPSFVRPTDTKFSYLNYFPAGPTAGVPVTRNNTGLLSYTVVAGSLITQRTTLTYLGLN